VRFEKLDVLLNALSVNISNSLFAQTLLSRNSKLFLHIDVVTQMWGKGSYMGDILAILNKNLTSS